MNKAFYFILIVALSSCSKQVAPSTDKPSWLVDLGSYSNRYITTGCSGLHTKGFDAQKKLATSRAIDKLAMQKGVIVNSTTGTKVRRSNGVITSSVFKSKSMHKTSNTKVAFNVLESYFDEKNQNYCILIERSN